MKNKPSSVRNPSVKLQSALDIIEKFMQLNAAEPIPHIFHRSEEKSGLKKIVGLARHLITSAFDEKMRQSLDAERQKAEDEVWRAVDDVQRYHPLVSKNNSEEEKALTSRALESIRQFNQFIEETDQAPLSWHKRLFRFLIKRSSLSIAKPRKIALNRLNSAIKFEDTTFLSDQIASIGAMSSLQRETDAFRMKAISLIKSQSNVYPSIEKALSSLKQSPIYVIASANNEPEAVPASSVVVLEQKLTPFPWETMLLKGAFIRRADSLAQTIPILDSFQISFQSDQTGFPHPALYTGWALSNSLIPEQIYRPDQIKMTMQFLEKKKDIALKLMPGGLFVDKAREIFTKKEMLARESKQEYLGMQKKFSLALINSALLEPPSIPLGETVENFFNWLEDQTSVYSALSNVNQKIGDYYISFPHAKLLQLWLDQDNRNLLSSEPKICFIAARLALETARNESEERLLACEDLPKPLFDYIFCMGKILGPPCGSLILQQLSELMEFPPPQLTEFEKKLQKAAFRQIEAFFTELNHDTSKISFDGIKDAILSNIDLFEKKLSPCIIVEELEQYYATRYLTTENTDKDLLSLFKKL